MKIIFDEMFNDSSYSDNSAALKGRTEVIIRELSQENYQYLKPVPASYKDIALAHTNKRIEEVRKDEKLYRMAMLSAGAACLAAKTGYNKEPAFACIRPPGHHASRDSAWGYCEFCNMGVALLKLRSEGLINSAFVLDFDAHTGDGTIDVLSDWEGVHILNPMADNNVTYIKIIEDYIRKIDHVDIIGVCAGFDSYEKDVGKKLNRFDFYHIGRLMKKFSKRAGCNRRFAVLEGGYYLPDLGKNVLAFCQVFD